MLNYVRGLITPSAAGSPPKSPPRAAPTPPEISDFSLYRELRFDPTTPGNKKIGEGTYGTVWLQATPDPLSAGGVKNVVFKVSKIRADAVTRITQTDLNEVSTMIRIAHPNVAKVLYCHFTPNGEFVYAMEAAKMDLWKAIQNGLTDEQKLSYCYQVIAGVGWCLQRDIIHRDLKPQNVLVTEDGTLQIADFGLVENLSCVAPRAKDLDVVTLWWRSPDIILGNDTYGADADIWAVAVILVNIIRGRFIFNGDNERGTVDWIFTTIGDPEGEDRDYLTSLPKWNSRMDTKNPDGTFSAYAFAHPKPDPVFPTLKAQNPGIWEVVMGMLAYQPKNRMTLDQAIIHPVFDSVRKTSDTLQPQTCLKSLQLRDLPLGTVPKTPDDAARLKFAYGNLFWYCMNSVEEGKRATEAFARLTKAYGHFIYLFAHASRVLSASDAFLGSYYLVVAYHYDRPDPEGLIEARKVIEVLKCDLLVTTPGDYIQETETDANITDELQAGAMASAFALFYFSLWPGYERCSSLEIAELCLLSRSTFTYPATVRRESVRKYLEATDWIYANRSVLVKEINFDKSLAGMADMEAVLKSFPQQMKTRPVHLA